MTHRYFSGVVEIKGAYPLANAVVRAQFPLGKFKRYDSFNFFVGTPDGKYSTTQFLPVTRIIRHNEHGTLHQCGSKCRNAKGGDCECSCGGVYHGLDRVG
jgi:hypothetical protein